jgi:hypothetical protein
MSKKILKRLDTQENRDYWAFVNQCAQEVEQWPEWKRAWARHFFCGQYCHHGNGVQTCREVGRQP